MPAGDRTGPQGLGPMTGRGAGFCVGFAAPGYAHSGRGGGFGRGFGRGGGFGFRNRFFRGFGAGWAQPAPGYDAQPMSSEQEVSMLKGQAEALKASMDQIQQRIEALENK